ncbi:hypothetical protein COCC4DRAFT_53481 [Bipolaris maydis ATCC 48331]|uniref:1-alkyl-2-acetylglycerophosphocholine esterase n=2 Tax=Cochliobolus heterostrophus TaxID=5016 RepID=M2UNG2_COCH5|nr:uncharacterized protein COCC4DRAFT_53481 [Bipolaris maydis ATCC 48331]EMD95141.1 hypothetical protein COCHEDRAFT_1222346 [Bipolaris maydis C5]KAH7551245.1 hypothetical protein BM1_10119 [Bipolaris maydis]ENI00968.1 hypothetical protein COCC4DRAFT_53481 [Bipolaris maydis ATCC 48331]KAJ5021778.1 hypothetical protein J3E73DRAFT_240223 [Bipolaris maydis]KAJ6214167.1 PAF acetylhydrolase family protein [Bipolaris maydis]
MYTSTALILAYMAILPLLSAAKITIGQVGQDNITIGSASMLLTDTNRQDPYINDGRSRSIMVSSYYPVLKCTKKGIKPYMPPQTAAFMDNKFSVYGLPNGTFPSFEFEACDMSTSQDSCSTPALPLVLFSSALGTSRYLYSIMLQSIASSGYLVISIDHPYDADIVEYPNGTIITGVDIPDDKINQTVATRADDISFALNSLHRSHVSQKLFPIHTELQKIPQVAILGHSLGGAAAGAAVLQIPSARGGINLDGTMFGSVLDKGLDRPFMLIGHANKTQETDPSWKTMWPKLRSWKKEIEVHKSAHYSFSDLPALMSALGLGSTQVPAIGHLLGTIEGKRMMQLTVAHIVAFLDFTLKSRGKRGFTEAARRFPEAVTVA